MALMIPNEISPLTRSRAERKMFEIIKKGLSSEWTVLHSLSMAEHQSKPWAEIDFVILGPPGVFCLEVKGGRIRREAGIWQYVDGSGAAADKREGPFTQANTAMFALMEYLREFLHNDDVPLFGFGVATPDVTFGVQDPEVISEVLYDERSLGEPFSKYMERVSEYWQGKVRSKSPMEARQQSAVVNHLRGDFDVLPALSLKMNNARSELLRLTGEQQTIIRGMAANARVLVTGSAGTGKTLCALEEARRLAEAGNKTLFCCYNRRLAHHLRKRTGDLDGLEVVNIHGLMSDLIRGAGMQLPKTEDDASQTFNEEYPAACLIAIKASGMAGKFDAVIIDEGQDLLHLPFLIDVIDPLLHGGLEKGSWRIFLDERQRIYGSYSADAADLIDSINHTKYELRVNCRNTEQIAVNTGILSSAPIEELPRASGPEFDLTWYDDSRDARRKIDRYVNRLLAKGVNPADIAVLSPRSRQSSALSGGFIDVPYKLVSPTPDQDLASNEIGYYTIQSFKGLESEVVLLVDIEDLSNSWSLDHNYVGGSRATLLLSAFLHSSVRDDYAELARTWAKRLSER